MIDGVGSPPFSAETIPPIETPSISYRDDVLTSSRALYGRKRADIEQLIRRKQEEFVPPPREEKRRRAPFVPAAAGTAASSGGRHRTENGGFRGEYSETSRPTQANPERPASQAQPVGKDSLRAAIERARLRAPHAQTSPGSGEGEGGRQRSPVDVLREKKAYREQRSHAPKPAQKPERRAPERSPRSEASHTRAPQAYRALHAQTEEISPRVLQQVINGSHRDEDDL